MTVRWWGSYLQTGITQVDRFLISFEGDVPRRPGDPDDFSHPGKPILSQIVYRDSPPPDRGIFTEMLVQDGPVPRHEPLYEYSANLAVPFKPQRNTVYWLKVVALGWREEQIAENAKKISELGQELHKRVCDAVAHVGKLGGSLEGAVKAYNRFLGSMESRVIVSARRFEELGAGSGTALPAQIDPIETMPREVKAAGGNDDDAGASADA